GGTLVNRVLGGALECISDQTAASQPRASAGSASFTSSAASAAGQMPGPSAAYQRSKTMVQSRKVFTAMNLAFTSDDWGCDRLYLMAICRFWGRARCYS